MLFQINKRKKYRNDYSEKKIVFKKDVFMRNCYPNLELIEYKCQMAAYELHKETLKDSIYPTFRIYTFMQSWANTATGFDIDCPVSGQAFTDEYTTVCEMSWCRKDPEKRWVHVEDKIYGVFFGNRIAYMFINPNEQFFKDLKNREMKSQRIALERYV